MPDTTPTPKDDLIKRLRRIEGQARGVARMVEEERDCRDIIQQLAAIRAATHQVGLLLARSYACQCMSESAQGEGREAMLDDLITILGKVT